MKILDRVVVYPFFGLELSNGAVESGGVGKFSDMALESVRVTYLMKRSYPKSQLSWGIVNVTCVPLHSKDKGN